MPYIKRNAQGAISAVSQAPAEGFVELEEGCSEELDQFLRQCQVDQSHLLSADLGFIRVLEDLIDLLISQNIIRFTDLPEAARQKMQNRQHLRSNLSSHLDLLFEEDSNSF